MASAAVARNKRKLPERLAQVRGDRSQRQFARDLGGSALAPYVDDGMKKELMAYALAEADRQGGEKGEGT